MFAKTVFAVVSLLGLVNSNTIFSNLQPGRTGILSGFRSAITQRESNEKLVSNSILELAMDISASQWEQRNSGNVVQSPLSIAALMNVLLLASRGDSNRQLKKALRYSTEVPDSQMHDTYRRILNSLGSQSSGVKLNLSSRLFLQLGLSMIPEFHEIARNSYGSQVEGVNFKNDPTYAMNEINEWVERETQGKITDLISHPFPTTTKFVAANVIYFNGAWEYPFSKKFTKPKHFDTGFRNISIPMMTTLIEVPYVSSDVLGFDVISLPYKGGRYSMYVVTPKGGTPGITSLQRVEYTLTATLLDDLIRNMTVQRVSVEIPRMKLSNKLYLKKDLKILNVHDIFEEHKADFGRLTTQTGIFVSDIVHEAVIEVTETGTVAAAASSATFNRLGGHKFFKFNRPSLMFIRDDTNGITLFMARIVEPEPIFN